MDLETHAQNELDLLFKENNFLEEFGPEMMALVKKFAQSGQSGGSAPYYASAISKTILSLLMYETLLPITGYANEWTRCSMGSDKPMYQNKREFKAFYTPGDGVRVVQAVVFRDQYGETFTGNPGIVVPSTGERISSYMYVKSFPFEYKYFYLDVIASEDRENYTIKDESQLQPIFEYYDLKPNGLEVEILS